MTENKFENMENYEEPEENMDDVNDVQLPPKKSNGPAKITPYIQEIRNSFNFLAAKVNRVDDILEKPYIDILLFSMQNKLSESEILSLVIYIRNECKSRQARLSPKDIEFRVRNALDPTSDPWVGRTYIGENDGELYIMSNSKTKDREYISNFVLSPKHKILVKGGNMYLVYNVHIRNDPKTYTLMLTADDFNKLDMLQERIKQQLYHTTANINGCASHMKNIFHKFVTLGSFEFEKMGTALIGLERPEEDGPKYFCTPDAIFDLEGNVSNDIVYMGNEHANLDEISNYSNLEYNKKKWYKEIAPTFLRNIIHINEKAAMMSVLGWVGSIPHDYVIRKEVPTGFFPHCHIVGEPGSGKSTVMTLLKQFMGHNDSSPRIFPTPFEVSKLLNSSYTIPVVLDEYGKRWDPERTNKMNAVLVEAFTRPKWSRGSSNLSSTYFKFKNPILMGGQIPTDDQALATRIVPIHIYKSFQNSPAGKKSLQHLSDIQKMKDKNFWVGFNIWCAQFTNKEVEEKYTEYRKLTKLQIDDNRVADIYAVVMLGLYYMYKLAEELGLSTDELGYTLDDIKEMPDKLDQSASATETKDVSPLKDFLRDLAHYAISIGNSTVHGRYFGKGLAVMESGTASVGAGVYGGAKKLDACIYDNELVLVKVDEMCQVLNKHKGGRPAHNPKEILTFIESEFRKSMANPTSKDNFVLAPKQYRNMYGMYTVFNKKKLVEEYEEFNNIIWMKDPIK